MNILVTGGAGYIGSVCVDELLSRGRQVVVVDNLQEGHRKAVDPDAVLYEGNCGDRKLLNEIFARHSIDAVMHFAADTVVEKSMTDPGRFFRNNVVNGIALLDTMMEFGCRRMIFSSTASTFGEPQYNPVDEQHPQTPINPYGESKLMFERILDWYHRAHGLKCISLRYFNAAGATRQRGDAKKNVTLIIPVIIEFLLGKRDKFFIFGNDYPTKDGTCIRDYIHIADLVKAHILALEHIDTYPNNKYNLGNGKGFSNLEVVQAMEKATGKPVPYEIAPRRPGDPVVLVASSERARSELGWQPAHTSLEEIVASAWEWHRKHPDGYE
ncbi:MAG: UDP-glucose 4-epimerase GalE [Deltaproteobacteria bacterium]|nr:UDP-glucose 4-epimerase GalE [Deltaproteobacteria bacterium]